MSKKCSKCGNIFSDGAVQNCPHPAVNKKYGKNICWFCCGKCKYHHREIFVAGYTCTYGKDEA